MPIWKIIVLAAIQGLAELLPVSSSAHVIVAEKLMGLDPTLPELTLLLVALHTGTMGAVIVYFARRWIEAVKSSAGFGKRMLVLLILATAITGIIGVALQRLIEKTMLKGAANAEIEMLFGNLLLIGVALLAVGILIIVAGLRSKRIAERDNITPADAAAIGLVQGLCLPFRGFSRSGATISTGMLAGVSRVRAEEFSFALVVILTPPVIGREVLRLIHAQHASGAEPLHLSALFLPSIIGLICSFLAGLVALKWLSRWLEAGHWYYFGIYCIAAAAVVLWLHHAGL